MESLAHGADGPQRTKAFTCLVFRGNVPPTETLVQRLGLPVLADWRRGGTSPGGRPITVDFVSLSIYDSTDMPDESGPAGTDDYLPPDAEALLTRAIGEIRKSRAEGMDVELFLGWVGPPLVERRVELRPSLLASLADAGIALVFSSIAT